MGRQMDLPKCCHWGSHVGTPGKSLPCFWEENQAWFVSCLSWGPHSGDPMFSVLSCCPSCLSSTSVSAPSAPALPPTPISILCASEPPVTLPTGQDSFCSCLAVPASSAPQAQGPCPAHPTLGAPPHALPLSKSSPSGVGIHSRLSSFPVPHPGLQRAAGGKPPGLCSLCLKSPG